MAHNSVYDPPVVVLALKAGFCAKAAAAGGEIGVSLVLISPKKGATSCWQAQHHVGRISLRNMMLHD
jgi:hypothetical protein